MAKELRISLGATGLTVTASVYLAGVAKATAIACAEIGVTGAYAGDFTATPNVAGVYSAEFFAGGATVSSGGGQIVWDGAAEVVQTGDNFARIGAAGAGLTALGDTRIANLDATVSSRTKPADTQARVTLVDTATTLTNSPSVPSAGDIAAATAAQVTTDHGAGSYARNTEPVIPDNAGIAAVKAKTDQLAFTVAGQVDANALSGGVDVAGVRAAVGLAAANLDTQLGNLPTNAELATALSTIPTVTPPTAGAIADAVWDEAIAAHVIAGSTGKKLTDASAMGDPWNVAVPAAYPAGTAGYKLGGIQTAGAGAVTWPYTLTDAISGLPIVGADVWVTSDTQGLNTLASGTTNGSGIATFYLDAGQVYVWRAKAGYDFANPDSEVIA